ncbi:MAG: aminotransferase class I/II-fold pyridoxal phosphate-dependent enzyme [Sporomusaceae bacterium]|nr:aminotransferase class I/II-fold pyridoxal phosphate-dependent enzyme [Sporomusaceae bacterium]
MKKFDRQGETPLLSTMRRYIEEDVMPFHTPGHKQGRGMDKAFTNLMGKKLLRYDLSLMSEWDDLAEPKSCLLAAEMLAAELYGADQSFFLVNGTTEAIQAMILATVGPGDKLILQRNSHRSCLSGLALSGARPVYVQPEVDVELGLAMAVSPEALEAVLMAHPDAKGVLLTSPTYYGAAADLAAIANLVHRYNMALLIDEAHGPHLQFHQDLPLAALAAGADLVAQSTHKILGAMTQCSMLHRQGERIDSSRLHSMLKVLHSTSPNYVLLASLEAARLQMACSGRKLMTKALALADFFRSQVNQIPGLYSFGAEKIGLPGIYELDRTKVTVTVSGLGMTGAEAEAFLRRKKIQVELYDERNVLFLLTFGDRKATIQKLIDALAAMAFDARKQQRSEILAKAVCPQWLPRLILSPREALFAATEVIPFSEAAGRISAEVLSFYPPGIPLVSPGEEITAEFIDYCRRMQQAGLNVAGPEDHSLQTIKVITAERKQGE